MRLTGNLIILILIVPICHVFARGTGNPKQCRVHEKWNDCGVLWWCEATCDQPEGRACPRICSPGCFCNPNCIREKANGTCIPEDYCKCEDD